MRTRNRFMMLGLFCVAFAASTPGLVSAGQASGRLVASASGELTRVWETSSGVTAWFVAYGLTDIYDEALTAVFMVFLLDEETMRAQGRAYKPVVGKQLRGALDFDLKVELREGGHHSGNWGGLLANPGIILANAIASIVSGRCSTMSASCVPNCTVSR